MTMTMSPKSDSIGEEIAEEIGLSMSLSDDKPTKIQKKGQTSIKSIAESIGVEIEGDGFAESSKRQSKPWQNRFTNSIITESNIVSEFEITNPTRAKLDDSKPPPMIDSTIMSTSVMGSKNLTGRVVKRKRTGSRDQSRGRTSLNRSGSADSDNIPPG